MKTFKTVLQTEYIGAIVIAMLYVQAVVAAIGLVNALIATAMLSRTSVLGESSTMLQRNAYNYVPPITSLLLHAATATALLFWLYVPRPEPSEEAGLDSDEAQAPEA